uniref:Uncharacterized protein n=1 Tax=Plectus sambesii TaxID=2011161 RepID=A0A914X7U1_9BILA
MQYSGLQVLAWMLLLVGTGALVASIATDYWSVHEMPVIGQSVVMHRGLLRQCTRAEVLAFYKHDCTNRWSELVDEVRKLDDGGQFTLSRQNMKAFEIITVALIGLSVVVAALTLLFGPCTCHKCGCCVTFWVLLSAVCSATAIGLYAYYTVHGETMTLNILGQTVSTQINEDRLDNLAWSFYLAVGGCVCQILSGLFFGCARARTHSYSHTI